MIQSWAGRRRTLVGQRGLTLIARPRLQSVLLLILLLGLAAFGLARTQYPLRWSGWAFGDAQAMFAADHVLREGWLRNYGLPNYYYPSARNGQLRDLYTHYPQMINVPVIAALRGLGADNLGILQAFHVLLSCLALLWLWMAFREVAEETVAVIAVAAVGLSLVWLDYMDSLVLVYQELFRFAALALLVRADRSGESPRTRLALLGGAWTACLLDSLNSCEYVVGLQLFVFGWTLSRYGWGAAVRRVGLFAAAPALGLGLHVAQVIAYLGWERAWEDARAVLLFRAVGGGVLDFRLVGRVLQAGFRSTTGVSLGLWLLEVVLVLVCVVAGRVVRAPAPAFLLSLLASGATWYFMFPESAMTFFNYMPRHLLPALAFSLALGTRIIWQRWKTGPHPAPSRVLEFAYLGLAASVLAAWISLLGLTVTYARDFPESLGPQTYPTGLSRREWATGVIACLDLKSIRRPGETSVIIERGVWERFYTTWAARLPVVSAIFPYYCDADIISLSDWGDLSTVLTTLRAFYGDRFIAYVTSRADDRTVPDLRAEAVALAHRTDLRVLRVVGGSLGPLAARATSVDLLSDPMVRRRWPLGSLRD